MYELPEVETIRRDLDREMVGKKTQGGHGREQALPGALQEPQVLPHRSSTSPRFTRVSRAGLYITIALDNDSLVVVSLGSTGSLRRTTNREAVQEGTEVVITFTQHGQLRLIDREGTAEIFIVDADSLAAELPEIEGYGIDPVEEAISWTVFGRLLLERSVKLKTLLTDSSFVVGIGPIYSDEILFQGRPQIRPSQRHPLESGNPSSSARRSSGPCTTP